MAFLSWALDRLREPTTWIGISTLMATIGFNVSPDIWKEIATIGAGVSGLALIVLKEHK